MKNPMDVFKNTSIPVYYGKAGRKDLPFLIYFGAGSGNFAADNGVYNKNYHYRLEYYFKTKDEDMEDQIEGALDEAEIFRDKSEDIYLDDEKMYVVYYSY